MDTMHSYNLDVTQVYIQSTASLERDVSLRARRKTNTSLCHVLKVVKRIDGNSDSGLHRYLTYLYHHRKALGVYCACTDPFLC